MTPTEPDSLAVFREFKNSIRIHLKQILKLDQHTSKVPMHTVALLVMIAYEALARYMPSRPPDVATGDTEWLFAQRHHELYGIHESIGRCIFRTIRNGLAHTYGIYAIPVDGLGEVRLVLTWKDGAAAHLRGVCRGVANGGQFLSPFPRASHDLPGFVCVDVEVLWKDLDPLFTEIEATLTNVPGAATQFEARMMENRAYFARRLKERNAGYFAPALWREFLSTRNLQEDA
jgi:hypothetical protein